METLTRMVSESFARHGFDRPLDYRRLRWSRWFQCDSPHSLLFVPSKPGIFAIAEDVLNFGSGNTHVGTAALGCPGEQRSPESRRMLAVLQFCEDDDMAYVLDRMFSHQNPMRARLLSGRCFLRYVVIDDEVQRRSICNALNQWLVSSAEKATGIGAHFASSLEVPDAAVARTPARTQSADQGEPHEHSPTETPLHSPPFPAGF